MTLKIKIVYLVLLIINQINLIQTHMMNFIQRKSLVEKKLKKPN